jgi:hypothetical protein
MLIARLINVKEEYQLALHIEKHMGASSGRRMMSTDPRPGCMALPSAPKPPLPYEQPRGTGIRNQKGKSTAIGEGPHYYKCKGFGHFAVVCPIGDKKIAFICRKELMAMEIIEETAEEETSDEGEEHLSAMDLPSCVIHLMLTGTKKELKNNPEWLRTNIFHTRMVAER